jgi:superfamily I DNA/RNA helicase
VSLTRRTTAPDEAHTTWLGLSDEQRDVVRWIAPTTCVVTALAGSGKTRVAIEWITAHADNC